MAHEENNLKIQRGSFIRPDNHSTCFVYKCGNVVELVTSANRVDTISRYRRRKNGEYIDLETRRNQKMLN